MRKVETIDQHSTYEDLRSTLSPNKSNNGSLHVADLGGVHRLSYLEAEEVRASADKQQGRCLTFKEFPADSSSSSLISLLPKCFNENEKRLPRPLLFQDIFRLSHRIAAIPAVEIDKAIFHCLPGTFLHSVRSA
jgi:hypothetical protein